jgi:hypothetical protein
MLVRIYEVHTMAFQALASWIETPGFCGYTSGSYVMRDI